MPLEILGLMVVVGLALAIGAVHLSGGSESAGPMGKEDAIARFLVDFPGYKVGDVMISSDGKIALLAAHGPGPVGLVEQMGRHRLTRSLDQRNVSDVTVDGKKVIIRLRDVTLPVIEFEVPDPDKCKSLLNQLIKSQGE